MSTTDCDSDTNPLPSKSSSSGYVITDALKAPRATTYTAQALFDQIMNGDIDLDPEYQRGPLFLLFCSSSCSFGCHRHRLARGEAGRPHRLHFPQLLHPSCYLLYAHPSHSAFQVSHVLSLSFSAVNAHDDGSEQRVCIDGKQRLTSIYRFMLGLVCIFPCLFLSLHPLTFP